MAWVGMRCNNGTIASDRQTETQTDTELQQQVGIPDMTGQDRESQCGTGGQPGVEAVIWLSERAAPVVKVLVGSS